MALRRPSDGTQNEGSPHQVLYARGEGATQRVKVKPACGLSPLISSVGHINEKMGRSDCSITNRCRSDRSGDSTKPQL